MKWQLIYNDGSIQNEGQPSNSIRGGKPDADFLLICDDNFEMLEAIELGKNWFPIFYRIKQAEMNVSGKIGEIITVTIFGRYNPMTNKVILFQWETDKETYDKCNQSYIDWHAIRNCANIPLEVVA